MLLILLVPVVFVLVLGLLAWRSWPWFLAIALACQVAGMLACAIFLLLGEAEWHRALLRAWPFEAWRFAACGLLGLSIVAAAGGATLRGLVRLRRHLGGEVGEADRM